MKKYLLLLLTVVVLTFGFFIINKDSNSTTDNSDKIKIVSTLFPLYDMAKQIGGDFIDSSMLLPPGVESHSFEPKPSDIVKIKDADIFMYSGDLMEPWVKDLLNGITKDNNAVFNASDGIELSGDKDPHYWLDFTNTIKIADNFTKMLDTLYPQKSSVFNERSAKYISDLGLLDSQYSSDLKNCKTKEIIYAGHYAFGFLSKRYGLIYKAAYGVSPDSEPSAQDIAGLINQVKKDNINYIFYEELVSPKVAQTISKETKAQMLILNPAHNLTKEQFDNGETFISIMSYNLDNLKIGLQCQ